MQDEFLRLQGILGKTIVFITHDFDEALRLADRIAIMKDGAVEQCDTPDQIVLNPATEYVAKFTEKLKKPVWSHAAVLADPVSGFETGAAVAANATVRSMARMLIDDARESYPVEDSGGNIIGALNRRKALDVLFGENR